LANHYDWLVRRNVARNHNTPLKTIERLANDEDCNVRYRVAKNPKTPQYIKQYIKIKKFLGDYEQS
jgi:hypothetical protein